MKLIMLSVFLFSCASHRTSQVVMMGGGFVGGGVIGAMSAPKDESQLLHGILWGGLTSSIFAVLSVYLFDQEKENNQLKSQVSLLNEELLKLKELNQPKLLSQGKGLFKTTLPEEAKKLIEPGEWKKYSLNQWAQSPENPNVWLHYNLMYEFIPPSTSP